MTDDITLQINISAGDINYAEYTVSALASQHAGIKNKLLVIDCCRPQKTKIINPDVRFPQEKFDRDVKQVITIGEKLLAAGVVSQIYKVTPDDPLIDSMSQKYLRGLYKTTHGAGGMVNMSYWIGFDIPDTRYLLHYDGDVLLYQKPGFSWVDEAIQYMNVNNDVVMSVPRLCPPTENLNLPSVHEGRPFSVYTDYWKNDWFSTRYFLWDREKVQKYLPFVRGKILFELLLRKYGNRAFPIDPEILMFKSMAPRGAKRLILKSEDAWLMHPVDKSRRFLDALPQILEHVRKGNFPDEQRGHENMDLDAWLNYINN